MRLLQRHILLLTLLVVSPCAYAQQDSAAMHLSVDDVVVTAQSRIISIPDNTGNVSLNMDALTDMPRLGGAVDVLKLLQYTPGVAATQEGNTAMYVRGGDAGNSRILLDGAPLYSPAHLLGFFSVLNTPHISGLTLYKSGIPACYGSSTASITEVRTHRHIPSEFHIEGNIGIIEADAAVKLPLGERFALFASARHSYASWLTGLLSRKTTIDYEFGDYGVGFVADVGRAGRLLFNTHFNDDSAKANVFLYNADCKLSWWNALGTLTLETPINDRVELSNMVYASVYDNILKPNITSVNYEVATGVADMGLRSGVVVAFDRVNISAGVDAIYRRIAPQSILEGDNVLNMSKVEETIEAALYASLRWPISSHVVLDAGVRYSLYANDKVWTMPEPRIAIELPLSSTAKLWASYNLMTQYIHLVPQSNLSFATDFYLSSAEHLPPQLSHNASLGYAGEALAGRLRWSVEAYYRYMYNVIEYDSRILDVLTGVEDHMSMLSCGRGESYGLETSVGYSDSYVDVQVNYTLSRSLRQFDDINDGHPFPAHSDRRHNLSLIASYKPSSRWTLSATFVYATGMPYTGTTALYISGNAFLREYGPYNGAKLPDLHHLDLSATYWFKPRKLERSGINLSIYNVYARKNPLMMSYSVQKDDETNTMFMQERRHAIYTIIPSISWTYKF